MSEEVGLSIKHLCSSGYQETTDGRGGLLPTSRQIPKNSHQKDSRPSPHNPSHKEHFPS